MLYKQIVKYYKIVLLIKLGKWIFTHTADGQRYNIIDLPGNQFNNYYTTYYMDGRTDMTGA